MQKCNQCSEDKNETDFYKGWKMCKICTKENRRIKAIELEKNKPDFIICSKCNNQTSDFRAGRSYCLDCERSHGRNYRKTTDKGKIWIENNKERFSELRHNYYEKNKKEIRKTRNERMKTDEKFARAMKHRIALSSMFRCCSSSSKHVDCSCDELFLWIAFQLNQQTEMTRENYGSLWNFDHVIPVNEYLNNNKQSEEVLTYLNIQPILKKNNLVKNKYSDEDQLFEHLSNVIKYTKKNNIDVTNNVYIKSLKNILAKHLEAGNS